MRFLLSKSDTVAHSIADTVFRGLFNAVVVAAVAVFVGYWAESVLERSAQRSVLRDFKNDSVKEALNLIIDHYGHSSCLRDRLDIGTPDCQSEISDFIISIGRMRDLMGALFPDASFSGLTDMSETLRSLGSVNIGKPAAAEDIRNLSSQFDHAVTELAELFE